MLIHSYLTNGFFEMAKVFLRSLLVAVGSNAPYVWLDTRGLTADECAELYQCYTKGMLYVSNRPIPMKEWAQRANMPVKRLRRFKTECENFYVTQTNRVWKLMTAGDDRVQALYDIVWGMADRSEGPDWTQQPKFIAHFDIDTLFRRPLVGLPAMMEQANIWLKLRPSHSTVKARITIDMILLNGADDVRLLFDKWRYQINRIPPAERPVGWGQASLWYAFKGVQKRLKYKTLPLEYGLPGRNHDGDIVWTGNVHKLDKRDCVKLFKKELKSIVNGLE
jgi:hypothetical protein